MALPNSQNDQQQTLFQRAEAPAAPKQLCPYKIHDRRAQPQACIQTHRPRLETASKKGGSKHHKQHNSQNSQRAATQYQGRQCTTPESEPVMMTASVALFTMAQLDSGPSATKMPLCLPEQQPMCQQSARGSQEAPELSEPAEAACTPVEEVQTRSVLSLEVVIRLALTSAKHRSLTSALCPCVSSMLGRYLALPDARWPVANSGQHVQHRSRPRS